MVSEAFNSMNALLDGSLVSARHACELVDLVYHDHHYHFSADPSKNKQILKEEGAGTEESRLKPCGTAYHRYIYREYYDMLYNTVNISCVPSDNVHQPTLYCVW